MDLRCCTQKNDSIVMDLPSAFCLLLKRAMRSGQAQLVSLRNGFILFLQFIHCLSQHHELGAHGKNSLVLYIRKLLFICLAYGSRLCVTFVGDTQLQKQSDIFLLLQRGMLLSERRLKHSTLGWI